MRNANALYVRLDEAVHEITRTPDNREALAVATNMIGHLLIAVIEELQEANNA